MSLYGVLRTGVSGLTAQASKLGTVGDNIANANTTGYKRSSIEFSSLVIGGGSKEHNPGGVTSTVRNAITGQGHLLPTTSSTDLAVEGNGFFVVSNGAGTPFLTRAGSFVPDGAGKLVNAAGFRLMGVPLAEGGAGTIANGFSGLQEVNITAAQLESSPSTEGRFLQICPPMPRISRPGICPRPMRRRRRQRRRPRCWPSTISAMKSCWTSILRNRVRANGMSPSMIGRGRPMADFPMPAGRLLL